MNVRPHHVFTHQSETYLLNVEDMTAARVGQNLYEFLRDGADLKRRDSACDLVGELEGHGLLDSEDPSGQGKFRKLGDANFRSSPIRNIALFITQNCNLGCTYCYGDEGNYGSSGHMDLDTAKKSVDWLIEQSGDVKKLGIAFFGGEPFLNFKLMRQVVFYAKKMADVADKKFEFSVTTNATLLSENRIKFLEEHGISPLVSFDGSKAIQDSQRPFKGGRGSFDVIVPKIAKLLQTFPNATARATLNGNNSPDEVKVVLREI